MNDDSEFEQDLTTFSHDLFLNSEYMVWRKNIKQYTPGEWHSLIVKLDKVGVPIERLRDFGEATFSKLVFSLSKLQTTKHQKCSWFNLQYQAVCGIVWFGIVLNIINIYNKLLHRKNYSLSLAFFC